MPSGLSAMLGIQIGHVVRSRCQILTNSSRIYLPLLPVMFSPLFFSFKSHLNRQEYLISWFGFHVGTREAILPVPLISGSPAQGLLFP